MAAALASASAQHVRWQTSEYAFDPYQLTAERLPPEDNTATSTSPGEPPAKGTAAAAAATAALPVKRRPGRQKRTSVLCQVGLVAAEAWKQGSRCQLGMLERCGLSSVLYCSLRLLPSAMPTASWLQVPDCNEELVDAKKYYRRYRICAAHCAM